MKVALLLSSVLILTISCHADFVLLPKITSGVKKFASDIGIIKTTPPNVKKEELPVANPTKPVTPLAETIYNYPSSPSTSHKPSEAFVPPSTSGHNQLHSDKKQTVTEDKNSGSAGKFGETQKPETTPVKSNPGNFPSGPGFLSPKNNITAIDTHGNVVFPDDTHRPDAAPITNSLVCEKGKAYPPNDPCGKTLDSVKVVCIDGSSLDENNRCRPNDL